MPLSKSLDQIAWDDLFSAVCCCGRSKQVKQSFCRECFFALPESIRRKLYTPMSEGYAGIYDEAKDYLKINTNRIKK